MKEVVLDTETTGLSVKDGHRIVEIGCIELDNLIPTTKKFHCYLNPERKVSEKALEVHGYTDEFLSDKKKFIEIADEFISFIENKKLIIHNAEFDIGFINHELERLDLANSDIAQCCEVLDTLVLARRLHPGQRNSLDALVSRYEINGYDRELHGALLDSKILGDVYLSMTGGQSDLDFSDNSAEDKNINLSKDQASARKKLKVIKVSAKEKARNLKYLADMKEETNVEPIWNQEHE